MRFSVIIPVYNGQNVIIRSLKSVINQNFSDYDIIVINDGSTDNTKSVIEAFIFDSKITNIRLLNTENEGRSAARNKGAAKSNSEFLCFLDADDEFKEEHLYTFNEAIKQYSDVKCFFADSHIIRDDNSWEKYNNYLNRFLNRGNFWTANGNFIEFDESFSENLIEGSLIPMCSTAINRSVFLKSNGFNEKFSVSEDFELWFRLSLKYKFIAINRALSIVYHHFDNTSHPQNKYKTLQQQINVTDFILQSYSGLSKNERNILVQKRFKLIQNLLYHSSNISPLKVLHAYRLNSGMANKVTFLFCSLIFKSTIKSLLKRHS